MDRTEGSMNRIECSMNIVGDSITIHDSTNIADILKGTYDTIKEHINHIVQGEKKEDELLKQDENGLDIMHHAIIQNNSEVGHYLMKKYSHVFHTPILQYTCNNYIHLACKLGNNNIWMILENVGLKDCLLNRSTVCYPMPCKHRKCNEHLHREGRSQKSGTETSRTQCPRTLNTKAQVTGTKDSDIQVRVSQNIGPQDTETRVGENKDTGTQVTGTENTGIRKDHLDCKDGQLLSIDFAAIYGHIRLVELILTFYTEPLRSTSKLSSNMLLRAINICSFEALKLLTQHKSYTNEEISEALYLATQKCDARCMEVLLSLNVPTTQLTFNMNLYHRLCLVATQPEINIGLKNRQNMRSSLAECFKVLIKYNIDVNSRIPDRTYPLYSLISTIFLNIKLNYESENSTTNLSTIQDGLWCLELLLEAGADPNFNEMAAATYSNEETLIISERLAFPSALVCVTHKISSIMDTTQRPSDLAIEQTNQFIVQAFEILLRYGAKLYIPSHALHVELLTDPLPLILKTLFMCNKPNPANVSSQNDYLIESLIRILQMVLLNGGNLERMTSPQCEACINMLTLSVSASHNTCRESQSSPGYNQTKQNDQSPEKRDQDKKFLEENDHFHYVGVSNRNDATTQNEFAEDPIKDTNAASKSDNEIAQLMTEPTHPKSYNTLEWAVLNVQNTEVNSMVFDSELLGYLVSLLSSSQYYTTVTFISDVFDKKHQENIHYGNVAMLNALRQTPQSLLHMVKLKVWERVGKKEHNLYKLENIPSRLKDSVVEIFQYKD